MNLHNEIMNLRCDMENAVGIGSDAKFSYSHGHRDARHSASEIALRADALIEALMNLEPDTHYQDADTGKWHWAHSKESIANLLKEFEE